VIEKLKLKSKGKKARGWEGGEKVPGTEGADRELSRIRGGEKFSKFWSRNQEVLGGAMGFISTSSAEKRETKKK